MWVISSFKQHSKTHFAFYDLYVCVFACLKLSFFLKCHGHTESHSTIPLLYLGGSNNIIGGVITFSLSISSSYAAVIVISTIIPYLFRIICETEIMASNNSKQWTTACITVVVDDHFVHRFFAGHHLYQVLFFCYSMDALMICFLTIETKTYF